MAASNEEPLSAVKTTFECPGVGLNERPSVAGYCRCAPARLANKGGRCARVRMLVTLAFPGLGNRAR